MTDNSDFSRERQIEIYVRGVAGQKPTVPVDVRGLRDKARENMSTGSLCLYRRWGRYRKYDVSK